MTKYQYWLTEEGLLLLSSWMKKGFSLGHIAAKCGVSRCALYHWRKKYPAIAEALDRKNAPRGTVNEISDAEVEYALRREALDGKVTAQIFWLKNRRPDKWRDKPEMNMDKAIEKLDEVIEKIGEKG
jgi:predicted DNA-binding protein YlxM (UPF0122 family)